jgi:hypothetical protein
MSNQAKPSFGYYVALGLFGLATLGAVANLASNAASSPNATATAPVVTVAKAPEQPLPTPQQVDRFEARVQQFVHHVDALTDDQRRSLVGNHDINVKARDCWMGLTATNKDSISFCLSVGVVAHCVESGDTETNADVLDFCRWIRETT